MTDNNHPITPPPELVEQWRTAPEYTTGKEMFTMVSVSTRRLQEVATQAARWGADQELEACCDVLGGQWEWDILSQCTGWKEFRDQSEEILRAARRPKPPSLKEQALALLDDASDRLDAVHENTIRRALEQLDD